MKVSKLKETILFSRIKGKDKKAFVRAYDLYVDQIYRFIFFKVSSKEEAEDLASVVFLKAWNYIQENQISDYKTLKALFYKIARTTIIDHYRKKSSEQNDIKIDSSNPERRIDIEDDKQNIHQKMEVASDMEIVEKKLLELKDEYREVIVLRFIEEFSISEIAKILDKSKGNVRVLIYRALKALRGLLEK